MKSEMRHGTSEAETCQRALLDLVEAVLCLPETRQRKSVPVPGKQKGQRPQTPKEVSA